MIRRAADAHEYPNVERVAREIGTTIGSAIERAKERDPTLPKKLGFALFVFEFGPGAFAWISSAERESMLDALEEFLARNGRTDSIDR